MIAHAHPMLTLIQLDARSCHEPDSRLVSDFDESKRCPSSSDQRVGVRRASSSQRAASRCARLQQLRDRGRDRPCGTSACPACRVPKKSPGPRSCEIALGDLEAVGRLGHRLQPLARLVGQRRLIQQEAVRRDACRARRGRAAGAAATGRSARRARRSSPSRSARRRRPRRPSSRRASASSPRANASSRGPSRPASSGRAAAPTRYAGNTSCARWSAISVAALRSTFSDSSTSG